MVLPMPLGPTSRTLAASSMMSKVNRRSTWTRSSCYVQLWSKSAKALERHRRAFRIRPSRLRRPQSVSSASINHCTHCCSWTCSQPSTGLCRPSVECAPCAAEVASCYRLAREILRTPLHRLFGSVALPRYGEPQRLNGLLGESGGPAPLDLSRWPRAHWPWRHRRQTPDGPPPQDPSVGAKGSTLLRLASSCIQSGRRDHERGSRSRGSRGCGP